MPTKRQYLQMYGNIVSKRAEIDNKHLDRFDAMINGMLQGKTAKECLAEQKDELDKQIREYTSTDEFIEARRNAEAVVQDKSEKIKQDVTQKLESLGKEIQEAQQNNQARRYTDLTAKRDYYQMSLNNLRFWNGENDRSFPDAGDGLKGWTLTLSEYLPYQPFYYQMKKFDEKEKELEEFEQQLGNEEIFDEEKLSLKALSDKQEKFNSLNGWQKFWARVLPAGWYKNAELYADMKAQQSAMQELGLVEQPLETNSNAQPVGEPLPEDESKNLEKQTDLNPKPEKQKDFEDLGKEVEISDEMEMNNNK